MNERNEASGAFFIIPKALIYNDEYTSLSAKAKLLYGLILDRMNLSEKNGWRDSEGETYIHFSVSETKKFLKCGTTQAVRLLNELEDSGLIRKYKQGQGKTTKIYITAKELYSHQEFKNSHNGNFGIPESNIQEFPHQETNNTKENNTDFSNTLLRGSVEEEVKENIGYDYLTQSESKDEIDSIVSIIADTVMSKNKSVHIGAENYPKDEVCSRLMSLNEEHIIYVLETLRTNKSQIRDIRAYILRLLFYAPSTMSLYYSAKFSADRNSS